MGGQRGADRLIELLIEARTETIYTLSGNHVMPVFDAAFGRPIRLIHTRHEAAAVHMADAHARMTGSVGIALVTGGPGHVNALSALCTARAGETPLLLLSGHAPLAEVGNGAFQELDQAALAAPLTKASWTVQSATELTGDVARAIRIAKSGRPGPVHLSLPSNVLEADCSPASAPCFDPYVQRLGMEAARMARARLGVAQRPLIVAPPALCTASGRRALRRLEALGVPVIPMESPRGIRDPSLGDLASLLADADVIMLLGKALDFTLNFGTAAAQAEWIVIDPEAALLDRAVRLLPLLTLRARADPMAAIEDLLAADSEPSGQSPAWAARVAEALARRPEIATPDPHAIPTSASLCAAIGHVMSTLERPILVCDGGEIGQWAQALSSAPDRIINGVAGSIGSAVPFAIGAKRAAPNRPVLAVSGDGAFGFHIAEFETAIREHLPFVVVLGNDGRWNAEHQLQIRKYGVDRAFNCDLGSQIRYDLVATAFGGHGELVTSREGIEAAIHRAFASGLAACVNVIIEGCPAP